MRDSKRGTKRPRNVCSTNLKDTCFPFNGAALLSVLLLRLVWLEFKLVVSLYSWAFCFLFRFVQFIFRLLAPFELADEGKELIFCRCLIEVLLHDLPKWVLVNRVFLLFSFSDADVVETDEISEDELPRCRCECGAMEKLLHFPTLTKKLYHKIAKLENCGLNCYETIILSNFT